MGKPIHKIKYGGVSVAIFESEGKQGKRYSVNISRAYKGADGKWAYTDFLGINEIPKAILALQEAYRFLLSPAPSQGESDSSRGKTEEEEELPWNEG